MKEVVLLSGKGGTGKTSLTAAFASLASNAVLVDCDVDAANLHLLLDPVVDRRHDFVGGEKAHVDAAACSGCGLCVDECRFDALRLEDAAVVEPLRCEGCGVCAWLCPAEAIVLEPQIAGQWFVSRTRHGSLVHARLEPGQENSGKLVAELRQAARVLAGRQGAAWLLVDGPPGTGCPVIASLSGADYVVLVSEPTLAGLADLQRAAAVADHFRIPTGVIINKADINLDITARIEAYAAATGRGVLGRIAYDPAFTRAQLAGLPVAQTAGAALRARLAELWHAVEHAARQERSPFIVLR